MNITNLVRIHEARVAHHVAAVGQIYSQDRAAPKLNVGGSVTVDVRVFGGAKVAAKKQRLDSFQEGGIGGHYVHKLAVFGTGLAHNHLSVLFQNLGLDLARMFIHQRFEGGCAGDDGVANFFDATWAKTVSFTGKAKRWRGAFV